MRYHVLATDYDGTIAHDGIVAPSTVSSLERLAASGRKLVLVTGRELPDLQDAFPELEVFDRVVTENGALLYRPGTREERLLTEPADERLASRLRDDGVSPLSVGRAILATWEPNDGAVLDAIRELGLELEIIFNKGAVMVLPAGVTKATGLQAALLELGLSAHDAVGVGDAENDHAFLTLCEMAAAVANALPALKDRSDLVLDRDHGAGVEELVERLLADDLATLDATLVRQRIGFNEEGGELVGPSSPRERVLVAGSSGSGKSTMVTAFLERLMARAYQVCLVDPEGDYEHLGDAVQMGRADRAPKAEEVVDVLDDPARSVVVNLLGLPLEDRPAFFEDLLGRLVGLRARTGRPHWLIVDEAHHLLPTGWQPKETATTGLDGLLLVTVHPHKVATGVLRTIDLAVACGSDAPKTIRSIAEIIGRPVPNTDGSVSDGEALAWALAPKDAEPTQFRPARPEGERQRHRRKYASGELGPDKSFWFRGPDDRLNLRAQNLTLFLQLADGVDDETWLYHLRQGEYSAWIKESINDPELAAEVAAVEEDRALRADESRERIRAVVEDRYTAPV
jgi:HAD superfamily hydrolase (TIGR01484 family)